jgi:beta-glucosidase
LLKRFSARWHPSSTKLFGKGVPIVSSCLTFVLLAATVHPEIWPAATRTPARDAGIERRVDAILARMSLEEKAGQVIQGAITHVKPEDVKTYHLGSILNGGGGWPGDVRKAKPTDWLALSDAFFAASMDRADGKQAIPVIWGSDAVHGHTTIIGATIFPQNIGLGATRNYDLIERIGEITATEMSVTGINWSFSPVVAATRDDRWGRTYETYSEDPRIVSAAAAKFVKGLQSSGQVIATAKHFLGDGGTVDGKDQGDTVATEAELRDIHAAGYAAAIDAGVQAVMASQNSWHGVEMHGNRALLTDVLKRRMGFDGFVVGDWNGHAQIPGCTNKSCPQALLAGVDMFMVPQDWKELYHSIVAQVRFGAIPIERLDDAVRRILRVKMRMGLFDAPKPSRRMHGGKLDRIGAPEHRAVARQAVRESLVLLKNDGALPIRPRQRVLVAGDGADDIGKQSGGWTVSWQGTENKNEDFPGGTSIWRGIRAAAEAAGGRATLSVDGTFAEKPDVAVVVFGENPYAEWEGDLRTIVYDNPKDIALVRRLRAAGVPVVSIFLSGRPLWVNPYLNASNAFVAAFLPGTEGGGVADVLFGASDFKGKLSFSWPKLPAQVTLNHGDRDYDPLFALGFGLTYKDRVTLPRLPVDTTDVDPPRVFFTAGKTEPWQLSVDKDLGIWDEAGGRKVVTWPGGSMRAVALHGKQPVSLAAEAAAGKVLAIHLLVEQRPTRPVMLGVGDGKVDVTQQLATLPLDEWRTIRVPLHSFAADLSRIDRPFSIATDGNLVLRFGDIEVVAAATSCENAALTAYSALLVLAPHPDDEALGFTGLIDAYVRAGKPVNVVVVTDGDAYCEACRFWKNSTVTGPTCSAGELSRFGDVRRAESTAAAKILGVSPPRFLRYPDTGLAAAWQNIADGKPAQPLRRSDFSGCTSCEPCAGYGKGPQTDLTADTLTASLREIIAAAPDGALIATTHWLDGHADHAALGNFVRRLGGEHPVAYSVIHANTPNNTPQPDCWYPGPAPPLCPCMNDEAKALADPGWVARMESHRFHPTWPMTLPHDAYYGEEKQFCLPARLYLGDDAVKPRAVRAYASQLGRLARGGSHPAAVDGIINCNGYMTSFVRRTEAFVLVEKPR